MFLVRFNFPDRQLTHLPFKSCATEYLLMTCTWKKYTTLLCEVEVLMWLDAWLPLFVSEGPENWNGLEKGWGYMNWAFSCLILRLVISVRMCATIIAKIRLRSHASLEDFVNVTESRILSNECMMIINRKWQRNRLE